MMQAVILAVILAWGRAVRSQLHGSMLMLTLLPFLLAAGFLGVVLWLGLQPLIDSLQHYLALYGDSAYPGATFAQYALGAIKILLLPLLAMWLLLPLMTLTALLLMGLVAMPAVVRHVARRHYPALAQRKGGTLWGSVWLSLTSFAAFLLMWLGSLPLGLFPPLLFVIHAVLWGWLTARVMVYDALANHASKEERAHLQRLHYWPLLSIGVIGGVMGTLPTLFWLGGVLFWVLLPILAMVAIGLYVIIFVFTGLWFQYYCLDALEKLRQSAPAANTLAVTS